jgi:porin
MGYAADLFKPVQGGLSQESSALGNLDVLLHLSLNPLIGLRRTSIRIHVQASHGSSLSSRAGFLQSISSLEAPRELRLYEAWIGHQLGSPRLSLLAGVYDVNSEFDVIPSAGTFVNSSFGFGPEYSLGGMAGPSTYPCTSLATRVRFEPSPVTYGILGVSDGVPGDRNGGRFSLNRDEGALISLEFGYIQPLSDAYETLDPVALMAPRARGVAGPLPVRGLRRQIGRGRRVEEVTTKVGMGGWAYTQRQEAWAPDSSMRRAWGMYLLAERLLLRRPDGTRALSGFVRAGTAADGVNPVDLALGGGLVCRGLLPDRPNDVVGLGLAHARNSSPFLRFQLSEGSPLEQAETVVELTYSVELGGAIVIQPDVQWVKNPGTLPAIEDALVFGLRAHVHLEYAGG